MHFQQHTVERAISVGRFIVETDAAYREAARKFGVSKTTIWKDVTERLPLIDQGLAAQVRRISQAHLADRHKRGGEGMRRKWAKLRGEME